MSSRLRDLPVNLSFVRPLRVPASPGPSPRSRQQQPQLTDDDLARCPSNRHSNRPAAATSSSLSRRASKIPKLVRQSPGSGLVSRTYSADGDTANSTPRSVTQDRVSEFNFRRSSFADKGYETSGMNGFAPSRIPKSALRLSGTLNTPATSDSATSSPRRSDKSRLSSPSHSRAVTPRSTAKKTQRKPSSDKVVFGKTQLSPSGASSTLGKDESPKYDDCRHVEPSPREQEQSPADLIIRAFASAPLRSRSSRSAKPAIIPRTATEEKANRAEAQSKTSPSQQPHQTDVALETLLPLPVGDMSPRQPTASRVQQRDKSGKISRQSSPSPSPTGLPEVRGSTTKPIQQSITTTRPITTCETVQTSQSSPRINDELDHPPSFTLETSLHLPVGDTSPRQPKSLRAQQRDTTSKNKTSSQSPNLLGLPKARSSVTKTKRQPATSTTPTTMSEQAEASQSSPRFIDEPDCRASCANDAMTDGPVADEITALSSSRNKLQSPKISKSSTTKRSGPTSPEKHHDACQSAASTKAKKLLDTENSSLWSLSTANGAGSTPDEHENNQLSSTPVEDVRSVCESKSLDVVDGDAVIESPRYLQSLNDEVDSQVTGAKRKTRSSVASKQVGTSEISTLWTELHDEDEAVAIAGRVDNLRRRLGVDDGQLTSSLRDSAGRTDNDVGLSSDLLDVWPTDAAAADSSHVAMDVEDITLETFPSRQRKSRRKVRPRGRPAAAERDLTWIADSATILEEYSYEFHDISGQPRSPRRDLTWTEGSATILPEYSDGIHENSAGPPRMLERGRTWTEDSNTMSVERSDEIHIPTVRVLDPRHSTSRSGYEDRKLEASFNDAKADNHQRRVPQPMSVEDDKTQGARTSRRRNKTSNFAANSNKANKPLSQNTESSTRSSVNCSPPPSPRLSSVLWNSEPHSPDASPILSHTDIDVEDDLGPAEDLRDEQDAESSARKMYRSWMGIIDGYTTLLARCHSYASNATMARRLTELRRKTATLIDAQKQFDDVVDPEIKHRIEAMRRRTERSERQVVTAGSEPGHREWMVRRAASELCVVSQVATALKQYADDVASRTTRNSHCYDTGATCKTTGTTVIVVAVK